MGWCQLEELATVFDHYDLDEVMGKIPDEGEGGDVVHILTPDLAVQLMRSVIIYIAGFIFSILYFIPCFRAYTVYDL